MYVAGHPGCSKTEAARGAQASLDSVNRVIRHGHMRYEQSHSTAHYRLFVTDAGENAVACANSFNGIRELRGS